MIGDDDKPAEQEKPENPENVVIKLEVDDVDETQGVQS